MNKLEYFPDIDNMHIRVVVHSYTAYKLASWFSEGDKEEVEFDAYIYFKGVEYDAPEELKNALQEEVIDFILNRIAEVKQENKLKDAGI